MRFLWHWQALEGPYCIVSVLARCPCNLQGMPSSIYPNPAVCRLPVPDVAQILKVSLEHLGGQAFEIGQLFVLLSGLRPCRRPAWWLCLLSRGHCPCCRLQ
jgi:hypothetical protein